ncbi:uncharacterized protein EV420DRAFT_1075482 [Desarmillaria tabescens]|uniref:Uncharacterized protein n=1 Tax=Armillaria tabescens TaxID=1929756 RepID=A0AA39MQM8_ARMTA|nr:uncharacterized protein EV420DRAFT_1075482 [Desarmillaria tabescens]KAK0442474.1 hypothetical protein EV420DRAFT_1075482 [Desarmillaria tabescens]
MTGASLVPISTKIDWMALYPTCTLQLSPQLDDIIRCPRGWVATSESASAPTRSLEAAELVITFAVASDANIFVRLSATTVALGYPIPASSLMLDSSGVLKFHATALRFQLRLAGIESMEDKCLPSLIHTARQWSRKKCLLASVIWQMISTKMAESSAILQFPCRFPCDGQLFFLVPAVLFSPLPVCSISYTVSLCIFR